MASDTWQSPVTGVEQGTMGERDGCRSARVYTSQSEEYERIRRGIGLVDYSYDGKFLISGPGAVKLLNRLSLPDVARLPIHRMMSSFLLTSEGAVLCDAHIAN